MVVFAFLGYAFPDSPNKILFTESIKQNEKHRFWNNYKVSKFSLSVSNSLSCYLSACDDKHWGPDCSQQCVCQNGALCHPVKGTCQCPPGLIGRYCEDSCPAGTFGKGCLQRCKCGTGGSCNKTTGECICQSGFTGTL